MAADVVELAEGFKSVITTAFITPTPVVATIQRVYKDEFEVPKLDEFRVDIWCSPYRNAGDIDRSTYELEEIITIVAADRYLTAGTVPQQWIDDHVEIVQKRIFEPINAIPPETYSGFRLLDVKLTILCDPEFLREHKVFWSEMQITARKLKP